MDIDSILQGLCEVEGVNGVVVADGSGQLLAQRSLSLYDSDTLGGVSKALATALDSIRLMHEDWEQINTQYSDGRVIIRNLASNPKAPPMTLALIADARLNPSFATIALRVAVQKLRSVLESGGDASGRSGFGQQQQSSMSFSKAPFGGSSAAQTGGASGRGPSPVQASLAHSQPGSSHVASSGLSWSGLGSTGTTSGVSVADAASSHFLTACTKALARGVGPMAKVFVKEGVQRVSPGKPFSKDMAKALIADLAAQISDPDDAKEFRAQASKAI